MQETIWHSYLFGYIVWITLSLGCFGLMLFHHAIRGRWSAPILRLYEAGASTLFPMAILFLPILFVGMPSLYPWSRPEMVSNNPALQHKAVYLNPTFFTVRAILYFAIWIGLTVYLTRSSLLQDRTGNQRLMDQRANVSAPGIVLFILSVTFAFTDWAMSLDPMWYSTVYGFWFVAGMGLAASSFVALIITTRINHKPYSDVVTPQLTRDIGNLMLTFTLLWAYLSLSQFLIMWSGNLPEEITYYKRRLSPGWNEMGTFLIVFQFLVPFIALLSGNTKRTPRLLMMVASWVLFMRVVDLFWIIVPTFRANLSINLMDIVALIGIGMIWLGWFRWRVAQHPLLPRHEPRLQEVYEHA
jgi:hypothetical protein